MPVNGCQKNVVKESIINHIHITKKVVVVQKVAAALIWKAVVEAKVQKAVVAVVDQKRWKYNQLN